MRVLLVTRNFPPLLGGMERLLLNAYKTLEARFEVALIGPAGCEQFVSKTAPTFPIVRAPLARFLLEAQWTTWRVALRFRPTVILAGSGLMAPAALFAARYVGAKAACFVHGLDLVADSVLYRAIFLPAIVRSDQVIANSRNTARLATLAGAESDRLALLHPGVSRQPVRGDAAAFRNRLALGSRPILLSVGRLSPRKGLCQFVRHALPSIVAARPETLFLVVGDDPTEAIKSSSDQSRRILDAAHNAGVSEHVLLLGKVDEETLQAAYAAADVFIFPAIDIPGDVEGYGMVALEAAASGLPTVAFRVGGVSDAVSDGISGCLVPPGDYTGFAERVLDHLGKKSHREWQARCARFVDQFTWDRYGRRLEQLLNDVAGVEA